MPPKKRSPTPSEAESRAFDCLSKMNGFRLGEVLCDVTLESRDGRAFEVHRVVMASCCPYFRALFTNNMRESKQDKIKMDVDARILEELIKFAYTCKFDLKYKRMADVQAILIAANMLLLSDVENACVEYICKRINAKNCVEIIQLAEFVCSQTLMQNILGFMETNFADFTAHQGFVSLPLKYVAQILASENLKLHVAEDDILKVALSWIQHDVLNRKSVCYDVLQHVRLPLIERESLLGLIEPELELLIESGCAELLEEADIYQLHPEKRHSLHSIRTQPRKTHPKELFVVGGMSNLEDVQGYLDQMDCLDLEQEEYWRSIPARMSTVRESAAVVVLHGLIYAIGGVSSDSNLSSVECYNPQLQSWTNMASLNSGKGQISGAVLDGHIYAVGGSDDELRQGLKAVERYDADSDRWEVVAPMAVGRGALGVATLNGKLFACGGASFNVAFSSVEMYSPRKDCWSSAAAMKRSRAFHDVVALHGHLYALGGAEMLNGEVSAIQGSVERYCPHTNQWTLVQSLYLPCWGVRAAVHQGNDGGDDSVYIVGEFLEGSGFGTIAKLTLSAHANILTSIPYHKPGFRIQAGVVILP